MKIAFVISTLTSGGSERVISILANELSHRHQVEILLLVRKEVFYPIDEKVKIQDVSAHATSVFAKMKWLRSYVKEQKFDVVVAFMTGVYCTTLMSLLGVNVPVVVSERIDPHVTPWFRKILRVFLLPTASRLVVQTKKIKQYYPSFIQKKTHVVYNPVIDEVFHPYPDLPRSKEENSGDRIISTGRFFKQKNQKMMIRAFAKVSKVLPNYQLLIRGDGPLRAELESLVDVLNLKEKVLLPGRTNDIVKELRASKLFVMSSEEEGMSNAMIEAICVGLPVVTTEVSGAEELVGTGGYIVPQNDEQAFADAIIKILSDNQLREQMGRENQEKASQFKKEFIVKQWEEILEDVILNK